jgi:hypothetical protein
MDAGFAARLLKDVSFVKRPPAPPPDATLYPPPPPPPTAKYRTFVKVFVGDWRVEFEVKTKNV